MKLKLKEDNLLLSGRTITVIAVAVVVVFLYFSLDSDDIINPSSEIRERAKQM